MRPRLSRRAFTTLALAGVLPPFLFGAKTGQTETANIPEEIFVPTDSVSGTYDSIVALARKHAQDNPEVPSDTVSGIFDGLDYNAYRAIRTTPMPLQEGNGSIAFDALPPGMVFTDPVKLSIIDGATTFDVRFDPRIFSFDPAYFDADQVAQAQQTLPPEEMNYSGFRLRAPLNRPDRLDEFMVFQGASYFRGVARGMIYGLSARGLAVDTAAPEGEEFPRFTHFWIEVPEPNSSVVFVRALLEAPSCAGAFEFEILPGETTVMQTRCRVFPRREIDQIGIAPLTSMYFFGPSSRAGTDDFRDAVHDSSGVQMVTGDGRRLWRSLANPRTLQVSAFSDENPKGFGLSQRPRAFGYFQDAEARYERRPSGWVEPIGNWGRGSVILVEIPVNNEFNDNIVAFWRPDAPLQPSEAGYEFVYRLHWCDAPPDVAPIGRVAALRSGAYVNDTTERVIVIDYYKETAWSEGLSVDARANGAPLRHVALRHLPDGKHIRVSFRYDPSGVDVTEFNVTLVTEQGPESESWLYRMTA